EAQGLGVELRPHVGVAEQRLDLGGEHEPVARLGVVERLDAEPVAGQEQPAPRPVPQREGEHPPQPVDAAVAVVLVEVRHDLGVALGAQAVAGAPERLGRLAVVVDLAVEDERHAAVLVRHRLPAAGEVDDRQAVHAHHDRPLGEGAAVVGPAVDDGVEHRGQGLRRGRPIERVVARDPAHLYAAPSASRTGVRGAERSGPGSPRSASPRSAPVPPRSASAASARAVVSTFRSVNSRSASLRFSSPIARRRAGSSRRARSASVRASTSPSSTSSSGSTRGISTWRVLTTALPKAIASAIAVGKPSLTPVGDVCEGRQKTSQRRKSASRAGPFSGPKNATWSLMPSSSASLLTSTGFVGPSPPTTQTSTFGSSSRLTASNR